MSSNPVDQLSTEDLNRLVAHMRLVDAYAFDYRADGKLAKTRGEVEREVAGILAGVGRPSSQASKVDASPAAGLRPVAKIAVRFDRRFIQWMHGADAIEDGEVLVRNSEAEKCIAELEAQNDLLRRHAQKQITDATLMTGLNIGPAGVDLGLEGGAASLLAEMLAGQFKDSGAVNYLELTFSSREAVPGERFVVTIQRAAGNTPGQKLKELRARISHLVERAAAGEAIDFNKELE